MGEIEWDLIQGVMEIVVRVGLPLLLAWATYHGKKLLEQIESDKRYDALRKVISDAVVTAEKLGFTEKLGEYAEGKYDFVQGVAQKWLTRHGIYLDVDELAAIIEAVVEEQFPKIGD